MTDRKPFTGRSRQRRTQWSVVVGDSLARVLITVGGVGTIVAVSTVFLFLLWVVLPLFLSAELTLQQTVPVPWSPTSKNADVRQSVLASGVDEFQTMGWSLTSEGIVTTFGLQEGKTLSTQDLTLTSPVTAVAAVQGGAHYFLGSQDGTVRNADFGFNTEFLTPENVTETAHALSVDQVMSYESSDETGVLQKTTQGQYRFQTLHVDAGEPMEFAASPIRLLAGANPGGELLLGTLSEDGRLIVKRHTRKENLITGAVSWEVIDEATLDIEKRDAELPKFLLLAGAGDHLFLIWDDGLARRYNIRNLGKGLIVAEETDLVPSTTARLTSAGYILGQTTFITADDSGTLRSWFCCRDERAVTPDKSILVSAQTFPSPGSPVTAFSASARSRIFAVGCEDSRVAVYQATTGKKIVEHHPHLEQPISLLLLSTKDDGLISITGENMMRYSFDPLHPEATVSSLFGKVWYESYPGPEDVWQSSGGSQDLEPKLGLMALIFGTLKATVYSMMFGAPLALLAAIYTSEFLTPSLRVKVKPTIELMASLPSVVLGFLAALVFAPFVEAAIPAVIAGAFCLPLSLLIGSYIWQLMPDTWSVALARWRLAFIAACLPVGFAVSALLGPLVEYAVFAGDMHRWLDGQIGSGIGGWFILFLPISILAMGLISSRVINPWLREWSHRSHWTSRSFIAIDGAKYAALGVLCLLLAWLLSALMTAIGFDPRGLFLGTYVQRNALVVGFVMGFAIIPIIYTIADDALSAVPDHLRSASLGAGATQWQTAVRIVVPAATSGLFSALMIGLGRAVGETMIVLMAGGNTPVMEWNVFNGFRTLSANIAVELPEAVRNSTHYRTLFLAALSLFVLTFLVNTIAELVRIRFRRRIVEL
ncbi:MAG: ABC transporter permease subunit [Planctomycetaceae bacterium]